MILVKSSTDENDSQLIKPPSGSLQFEYSDRSLGPSHYVPGLLQCQRTAPLNVYVLILDDKTRDAQVTQLAERRAGNQSRASLLPGLSVSSSLATAS